MSYVLNVLSDRPVALWPLSDTSPFQDVSGYDRAASATGSPPDHPALVAQEPWARIFHNTAMATVEGAVFQQGKEANAFSLEAWVLPITVDVGEQAILSHEDEFDGLTINGTVISFVTKYAATEEARVSYDIVKPRAVHVIGTHTLEKNQLYIDGEMVAEIDITDEQQADEFSATGDLVIGQSSSTQRIVVNGAALYMVSLPEEAITRHFTVGRDVMDADGVTDQNSGVRLPMSSGLAGIFLEQTWNTDEDWATGVAEEITIMDGTLYPTELDGAPSLAGTWESVFPLEFANADSIFGVQLDWVGEGATVEVSLDDSIWEEAVRGKNIDLIPQGFDPLNRTVIDTNGFTNPSGEVDLTNVSSALPATEQEVTRTQDQAYEGEWSFINTAKAANTRNYLRINHFNLSFPTGTTKTFKIRCYLPSTNTGTPTHATVLFRDDIAGSTYETITLPTELVYDEWFTLERIHTVPATRTLTRVYWNIFFTGVVPDGDHVYFDAWQSNDGEYFDGDTQDETHVYTWTGTEGLSISEKSTIDPAELIVRVSFPGGVELDESYLSELTVTGYSSDVLPTFDDHTFDVVTPASFGGDYQPIEYRDDNGIYLDDGSITIGPDTSDDPVNPLTVEMWVKRHGSFPVTPTSGRTIYLNGQPTPAALTDIVVGQWTLVHIVYNSAVTGDLVISGDVQIGQVVYYEDALTTTEIANTYKNYTGKELITNPTTSVISMSESPLGTHIYAHDWSVTGGG